MGIYNVKFLDHCSVCWHYTQVDVNNQFSHWLYKSILQPSGMRFQLFQVLSKTWWCQYIPFNLSGEYIVLSNCDFHLHDDQLVRALFNILIIYLDILFCEMPIQVFCPPPFFSFSILLIWKVVCIFWIKALCLIYVNIFFYTLNFRFTLIMISLNEQKAFVLMKPGSCFLFHVSCLPTLHEDTLLCYVLKSLFYFSHLNLQFWKLFYVCQE